jgi:hypothetical protein
MKTRFQATLGSLLLVSLAAPATAEEIPVRLGSSRDAESFHASRQTTALMKDGSFAAAWTQSYFPRGIVRVQYVRTDGSTLLGALGRNVTGSNLPEVASALVAHVEGGVFVALQRPDPERSGSTRLVVQRLDAGGHLLWKRGALAAPVLGSEMQGQASLLAHADGGAFVCFTREAFLPGFVSNPFCQRFSPEGRRLWNDTGVRATVSHRLAEAPQVVADGNGGLLVFWRDAGAPGATRDRVSYRGQRLAPDGHRLWGDEGRIVYTTRLSGFSFHLPAFDLVPDGSAGAILAFDDGPGSPHSIGDRSVIVQRVNGDGENLWGDGVVVASGPLRGLDSLIAGPEGGAFVGVLTGHREGGARLAFHRLMADGRSVWPADGVPVIDTAVADERDSDFYAYGHFDGDVLRFAWEHHDHGEPVFSDIRVGALDLAGRRLAGAEGRLLTGTGRANRRSRGFAFNPENESAFAVWESFFLDNLNTLGAVFTPPGL